MTGGRPTGRRGDWVRPSTISRKPSGWRSAFPVPYNNRADAYISTGALDWAIKDLDQAIKLEPTFAVAYVNRATAYAMLGNVERVRRDVNVAVGLGIDRRGLEDMIKEIRPVRRRQRNEKKRR